MDQLSITDCFMKIAATKIYFLLFTIVLLQHSFAQNATGIEPLPVNTIAVRGDTSKPIVLYITGNGGWNKFSKKLCQALAEKGYPIVSLNATKYFWKKKTATQTSLDITRLIRTYLLQWNCKKIMLIGYSFGAEVIPIIFNLLPADVSTKVVNISLLSPSPYTDFEIHILPIFDSSPAQSESVIAAINKISSKPLTLIFGKQETIFPINQLKINNYATVILEGGHHYDKDATKLTNAIIEHTPQY